MRATRPLHVFLLLTALHRGGTAALAAQEQPRPTRVPVTVGLADKLPAETPFQIMRRAGVAPHDVILLRHDADGMALSAAVEQLLLVRRVEGDTAPAAGTVRVRRPRADGGHRVRMLPWAGRVITDLQAAQRQQIDGVGSFPSLVIWLPPQRKQDR